MSAAQALATAVTLFSSALALAMAAALLLLVIRRRRYEAADAERTAQTLAASRYLTAALIDDAAAPDASFPPEIARAALSHLLLLVRGEDRDRLLAIAERDRFFDDALARLRHRRPARRVDAIASLEQFAGPLCVGALSAALHEDRSAIVRLEAAAALARLDKLPPPRALIGALALRAGRVSRVHAALFRSLAPGHASELLDLAWSDDHRRLRPMLVEALGWTGDLALAKELAPFASDPDAEVRAASVRAARQLGYPDVGAWVPALLDDPSVGVRVQAAQACGQLGIREAIPALERLAVEPAWWVRTRARAALDLLRPGGRTGFTLVARQA